MTDGTWKSYGSWHPTAQLRWRSGKLEQVWRRNFEERHGGGVVMGGGGHEDEWREVPCHDEQNTAATHGESGHRAKEET
jgi:hypothetical protein